MLYMLFFTLVWCISKAFLNRTENIYAHTIRNTQAHRIVIRTMEYRKRSIPNRTKKCDEREENKQNTTIKCEICVYLLHATRPASCQLTLQRQCEHILMECHKLMKFAYQKEKHTINTCIYGAHEIARKICREALMVATAAIRQQCDSLRKLFTCRKSVKFVVFFFCTFLFFIRIVIAFNTATAR